LCIEQAKPNQSIFEIYIHRGHQVPFSCPYCLPYQKLEKQSVILIIKNMQNFKEEEKITSFGNTNLSFHEKLKL
jgi:adenine deaminase